MQRRNGLGFNAKAKNQQEEKRDTAFMGRNNQKADQEVFMRPECAGMGEKMQSGVQDSLQKENQVGGKRSFRMLLALLESQGYLCALTGVRLEIATAELDHKIPVCRGGTNDLSNLQWIHKSINRAKGTMTNEEFIEACLKVAAKHQGHAPLGQRYFQGSLF